MMKLTDKQLARVARSLTTNPTCSIWTGNDTRCGARCVVNGGVAKFEGSCSGYCTFLTETFPKFAENVQFVKRILDVINLEVRTDD